jgi:hypothetical protein
MRYVYHDELLNALSHEFLIYDCSGKRFTVTQKKIIESFRFLHLNQQQNERRRLEVEKLACSVMLNGTTPQQGLIYSGTYFEI